MKTQTAHVDDLVARARASQKRFEYNATQERYDHAALAVAWALMHPERNAELSGQAVKETGLGKVCDKIKKNHRKTLGLLRDIKDAKTVGIIKDDVKRGIIEIARPVGVVGAIVPSTNPVATPVNNIINALKCGNAIILAPSPKGASVCRKLLDYIHAEFDRLGLDHDLVQMVSMPASKAKTQRLMETVDLLVVTGSQDNVRRAYSSGTPAIGVGAGNVTVIVDETADLTAAAEKITASKTFDNATSCSSENVLIVVDDVYDDFIHKLHVAGGRMLDDAKAEILKSSLFQEGQLNRELIARDLDQILKVVQIDVPDADTARFLLVALDGVGCGYPESGEKMALVAAIARAKDFQDAKQKARAVLEYQGAGHSVGLHSTNADRALELGYELPTCRVIVNQAHCFATGGAFDNGLPFSLSMGCGSWGSNSIDENLNYTHFMNRTRIVRTISPNEPKLDVVFGEYWDATNQ